VQELNIGDVVQLAQGQRHRLVGLNQWGVLAEIWQHTDPSNPSDEDDIVRVQDDFGR
jgi:mannose-6-phosphate isomerase